MSQYEAYAECKQRDAACALKFLDAFVPERREVADEYPLPELSDSPREVFKDASALIEALENEGTEEYSIYWDRVGQGDPHQAILVFTADGGMIAGLASANPESSALLKQLASIVGASYGVIVLEERPPSTLTEFRKLCERTASNRIIDGQFQKVDDLG